MHWKRWITALVIIPPLVLLILKGGTVLFTLFAVIVVLAAQWEFYRIVFDEHQPAVSPIYAAWGYLNGALILAAASRQQFAAMFSFLAIDFLGVAVLSIFRFKKSQDAPMVVLKQVFGLIYFPVFFAFGILVRNADQGQWWFLFIVWIVAFGDAAALYVGTYLGRHKLAPAVSPKKSIEGAVAGLAANILFGLLFKILFLPQLTVGYCVVFTILVGLAGQAGDLFESEFKRAAGVKDSGNLLPGHGGVMDRIDALVFALPLAYLLKEYLLP